MDHFRRLGFAFFMLASVVAMLAPKLARAQYEYTAKVASTTGGTAKTQQWVAVSGGTWVHNGGATTTQCATSLANGGASGYQTCEVNYVNSLSSYSAAAGSITYSADGTTVFIEHFYCGPPKACTPTTSQIEDYTASCPAGSTAKSPGGNFPNCQQQQLACPAGTVEGAGGLCYALVCPTATPAWEPDPGNSSQCRRPLECPWPQKFVVQSGTCECDSGTAWAVPEGGGLATPVHGVATVPWTSADMTNKPATGCASATGAAGQGGCTFTADAWGWNGSRLQIEGDTFTGAKCTVGGSGSLADTKACPSGQVAGTINGQTVCVTAGKTTETKPPTTTTTTKTNPDGTTETTTTTTTETTVCDGGNCTTTITKSSTVTTKDAQGNTTGTTTTTGTETKPGGANGTGDGDGVASSFGGACPSFSCEGDAVQCAIALEQHKRNCELLTDQGGLTREAAVEAFDEARTFDDDQLTTEGTLAGVSSSTFLGGGCLADAVYTIKGETITIPFSSLCVYIQAAGLAFLAVCGLISFGIVSRGVTA